MICQFSGAKKGSFQGGYRAKKGGFRGVYQVWGCGLEILGVPPTIAHHSVRITRTPRQRVLVCMKHLDAWIANLSFSSRRCRAGSPGFCVMSRKTWSSYDLGKRWLPPESLYQLQKKSFVCVVII